MHLLAGLFLSYCSETSWCFFDSKGNLTRILLICWQISFHGVGGGKALPLCCISGEIIQNKQLTSGKKAE